MTGTEWVLVDSSGWLEALTGDILAPHFQPYLEREADLVVPTIVIYEVRKKLKSGLGDCIADQFLSHALRARVVALDEHLAVAAASISIQHRLAMADAIIYATARALEAELITGDASFENLPNVILIR